MHCSIPFEDRIGFHGSERDYVVKSFRRNGISDEAADFVASLLQLDPAQRLEAQEALLHNWLDFDATSSGDNSSSSQLRRMERMPSLNPTTLANLEKESKENEFRRILCTVAAHHIHPDELVEYRQIFRKMDVDKSGFVTQEEFTQALSSKMPESNIEALFLHMDLDKTAKINQEEFLGAALALRRSMNESRLLEAFHHMDVDHNGMIDKADLTDLLQISDDKAKELLQEATQNDRSDPKRTSHQPAPPSLSPSLTCNTPLCLFVQ